MRVGAAAFVVSMMIGGVAPAVAQQVDITAPVPRRTAPVPDREREAVVLPPGDHRDVTRPSDADYYPRGPRVRHDPAYIVPLSSRIAEGTGRAGIAGWTAPNTPASGSEASGFREVTGWFALGIAVEWGGPPPRRAPARAPGR
ncbi:MAG TPA: hypothetical protein VLF19_00090 [Methylomirabilota bacterium]|nr:hypothetical protein [Methylomirabilota bacterium]